VSGLRGRARLLVLALIGGLAACELSQVTVAQPQSVVIAEVYLRVHQGTPSGIALLHRTLGGGDPTPPAAQIRLSTSTGEQGLFRSTLLQECIEEGRFPEEFMAETLVASCHRLDGASAQIIRPGARLDLRVELADGGVLTGRTTVPGDFKLLGAFGAGAGAGPAGDVSCLLPAETPLRLEWARTPGVWAYVPELSVAGLRQALSPEGDPSASDPLTLIGLAISEADTSIVLPGGFGVFNRFSAADREVLVALQSGFPRGSDEAPVTGRVEVSAVDRNTTNWNRGGNFNPSGAVRVPSVFGSGSGVFGAVVNRGFDFQVHGADRPVQCTRVEGKGG
jgi:hypothetical protein